MCYYCCFWSILAHHRWLRSGGGARDIKNMVGLSNSKDFPGGSAAKTLPAVLEIQEMWVQSLGWEDPPRRAWPPPSVLLPGKSYGQRSLERNSPEDHRKLEMTAATKHTCAHRIQSLFSEWQLVWQRKLLVILTWMYMCDSLGFCGGSEGKASACNAGDSGSIPGSRRSLEKEMATHYSTLAWKIPWTEKPGRLVDYNPWDHWGTSLSFFFSTCVVATINVHLVCAGPLLRGFTFILIDTQYLAS